MRYWTLGVALTEKNLEPGGALLKSSITGTCQGLFTQHTHNLTNFMFAGILLFVYKQRGIDGVCQHGTGSKTGERAAAVMMTLLTLDTKLQTEPAEGVKWEKK